jgi:predicted signal transduction protein with EAL and GGDEF domain
VAAGGSLPPTRRLAGRRLRRVHDGRQPVGRAVSPRLRRRGRATHAAAHRPAWRSNFTEPTPVDDAHSFILALQRRKALGVRLSIADFGTGYSNLSCLQRFAVDKLKVDRSFIVRLNNSRQDRAIVDAIVQVARSLDRVVTAEGIEDASLVQAHIEMAVRKGRAICSASRSRPANSNTCCSRRSTPRRGWRGRSAASSCPPGRDP